MILFLQSVLNDKEADQDINLRIRIERYITSKFNKFILQYMIKISLLKL